MEFGAGVGFNDILAFGIFSAIPRAVCRAAARWGALKNRDLATADDDVGGPIYLGECVRMPRDGLRYQTD